MTDSRRDEETLRRALHDAADHLPERSSAVEPLARRPDVPRWRRPLISGLVALLVIAAIPVGTALLSDDGGTAHKGRVHGSEETQRVLDALAATVGSGSYDLDFTFHVDPGTQPGVPCTMPTGPGTDALCGNMSQTVDVSGHGTVNTAPYAMAVVTNVSSLGAITLFVNPTTVWEFGGADYGTAPASNASAADAAGNSLSGFAGLVEGTLGQGQGALSMISLANNTGYLGLESEMVHSATTDGTGKLDDGTPVTYYRVEVDVTKMADAPALSDEQRQAINDALDVLNRAGYTGTDERLAVDDAGFIREVTATTNFGDGGSMTRHSLFSNFGCAPHVSMPNEPPDSTTTGTCTPGTTTTTPATTTPATNPTTSTAPTTTTTEPTTATTPPDATTTSEAPSPTS